MNNEPFALLTDVVWQQYQFTFSDDIAADQAFSDLVREKLSSLDLPDDNDGIRFEQVPGMVSTYNVYIRQSVEEDQVRTLLQPHERLLFKKENPTVSALHAAPGADFANDLNAADRGTAQPGVETVMFKGAIRTPPQTSDPLP